jgi:hypothetical protein
MEHGAWINVSNALIIGIWVGSTPKNEESLDRLLTENPVIFLVAFSFFYNLYFFICKPNKEHIRTISRHII